MYVNGKDKNLKHFSFNVVQYNSTSKNDLKYP